MAILLLFACVLALVLIDVPIAVALGIVALVAMVVTHGIDTLPNLPIVLYNGATSFPLIAIPLFILAGAIMNASGISQAPDRLRLGAARLRPRRPGDGLDRRLDVLRRDLGLGGGRCLGAGLDPDPGHEEQGLPGPAGRGHHVLGGHAGGDHPALDPDDPVRRDGRDLGGEDVRRRHRAGIPRRLWPDGHGLLLRAALQPAARGSFPVGPRAPHLPRGLLGVDAAADHPGLDLRRHRHGHRGRRAGRGRRALHRPGRVPRTRPQAPQGCHDRGRRADRRGDAAGGGFSAAGHLPDRDPGAAATRSVDHRADQQQVVRAGVAERAVPDAGHVPAFGRSDHPGGTGGDAAGARGRHRPDPLRPGGHDQPGHRPADAAGGLAC